MASLKLIVPLVIAATFLIGLTIILTNPNCTTVSNSPIGTIHSCPELEILQSQMSGSSVDPSLYEYSSGYYGSDS